MFYIGILKSDNKVRKLNLAKAEQQNTLFSLIETKIATVKDNELLNLLEKREVVTLLTLMNPNVTKILTSQNLTFHVYSENIKNIEHSHISRVAQIADKIAKQMDISFEERKLLKQGAELHDYGKILIPSYILEKENELTRKEKAIIKLHSELGYELLSSTSMDKRVLGMIRNHHKKAEHNPDILGQIITVADIFAALTENRVYKTTYNKQEALITLDKYSNTGLVNRDIVTALRNI